MYITLDNTDYYAYTGTHQHTENKPTIVFVHGTSMDHTVWSHQSRYFAYHGFNVLAIDLPAHKFSGGSLLPTIEKMADWLNQLFAHTRGNSFHLVGHSMGALITLEAAARYIGKRPLKSLSLLGFCYPMMVAQKLQQAARDNPTQAYSMMTQWSHASGIGGEPVPGFWSSGMQMSMMKNSRKGSVYSNLMACNHYRGGETAFDKVYCPILFLSGRKDKMAPAKRAKEEADKNELADIVLIENCGHNIMSESPDRVLDTLKKFIGRHV